MSVGGVFRAGLCMLATVAALLPTTSAHAATRTPYSPGESVAYQVNAAHDGHMVSGVPALPLQQKWSRNLGGLVSYPIVAAGKVFVTARGTDGRHGTYVYAMDAGTGATAWGPIPLGGLYHWSGLAYGGGRLYAVNGDGVLRAFDPATGVQRWIRQLPGQYSFSSEPTYADGIVYVGGAGSGGTLYAVSAVTGAVLWTRSVANGNHSSPAVSEDGVFVSYSCPNVYGFEPVDGQPLWAYGNGCTGGGGRTPVLAEGLVWVRDGTTGGIALDTRTGQLTQVHASITAPAFDGTRGFFREGSSLVARAPRTQAPLWTFDGDGQLSSAPIVVGNHVYVGSSSGTLYAVDAVTGLSSWSGNAGAPIRAPDEHNVMSPVAGLGAGHGLVVAAASNLLVAYGGAAPQPSPPPQVSVAWGWNVGGQLGDSGTTDRHVPATVAGDTSYRALSGGVYHSLAVRSDGTAWAWGWNGVGQLGDGTVVDRHRPVRVSGLAGVTSVDAGGHHNLAVRANGLVSAWGWNAVGQLGDGTRADRRVPVAVTQGAGLAHATAVSAGLYHSMAVSDRATAFTWGWNGLGTLGDGTTSDRASPVRVTGLTGVVAVDAGGLHSVAIDDDGRTFGWGWNAVGQLGDGTTVDRRRPVLVGGSHGASVAGAGLAHTVVA